MVEGGSSSGRATACFHRADLSPLELMNQPLRCLPVPQESAECSACWWHQGRREGKGMNLPRIANQTDTVSLRHPHHEKTALQSVPCLAGIEQEENETHGLKGRIPATAAWCTQCQLCVYVQRCIIPCSKTVCCLAAIWPSPYCAASHLVYSTGT